MNTLKTQLMELGLSDKESSTYLAMLELGPSSVQDIAKKAGVNRATAYVMLESLKRRGLMSSVERGKKSVFVAESPERLVASVAQELQTVEDRKARLASAMPQFMALFNAIEDKPKVRFFEGEEGVAAARDVQQELFGDGQSVRAFVHFDAAMVRVSAIEERKRLKPARIAKSPRLLYTIEPGLALPPMEGAEARRIPESITPFKGELNICDTFILIGLHDVRPMAVIIESADAAQLFQRLFDLAWLATSSKT